MVHVPSPPKLVVRVQESGFRWREWATLGLFWLASLIVAVAVTWLVRERIPADGAGQLKTALDQTASLQQRVAVLERAEQVARTANAELQRQIGERQGEIAGLRADLAFYSRLTAVGAKRDGLNVQSLHVEPVSNNARMVNFTLTLTQNLKPGQVTSGRIKLNVSGMRAEKMATVDWGDLAQNEDANGLAFSFKYFQQIKGTLLLPEGFTPNGVHVDADGGTEMGRTARDFGWAEALANTGAGNAGESK